MLAFSTITVIVAPEMVSMLIWPSRVPPMAMRSIGVRDADHEDRLLVLDDAQAGNAAGEIECDQGIDGLAGVCRDLHHITAQKGVTEEFLALIDRNRRRIPTRCADAIRTRKKVECLPVERGRVRQCRGQHQQQAYHRQQSQAAHGSCPATAITDAAA